MGKEIHVEASDSLQEWMYVINNVECLKGKFKRNRIRVYPVIQLKRT